MSPKLPWLIGFKSQSHYIKTNHQHDSETKKFGWLIEISYINSTDRSKLFLALSVWSMLFLAFPDRSILLLDFSLLSVLVLDFSLLSVLSLDFSLCPVLGLDFSLLSVLALDFCSVAQDEFSDCSEISPDSNWRRRGNFSTAVINFLRCFKYSG